MPRRFLTMILMFVLVFTTAAGMGDDDNGDDDDASASPAGDLTPEQVLENASGAWAETESAHFTLAVDGDAYLD